MSFIAPLSLTVFKTSPLAGFARRLGCSRVFGAARSADARAARAMIMMFAAVALVAGLITKPAAAQSPSATESVLYSFCAGGAQCPDNASPYALIQASDGNYYGITFSGGANASGSFFRMTPAGAVTDLYDFCSTNQNCPDGFGPTALIQASDGNFYGVTSGGGATRSGTVFRFTSSGTLTTLYTFCTSGYCPDGQGPVSLVQGSDGNFYGTTSYGGDNTDATCFANGTNGGVVPVCDSGTGTLFKLTPTGTLTTLHTFCSVGSPCSDGQSPAVLIQGSDGNFYGTTQFGGSGAAITFLDGSTNGTTYNGGGTVFKITPSGQLTTLYSFCKNGGDASQCADGFEPNDLIEGNDGNLYGTTQYGGTGAYAGSASSAQDNGAGNAFRITPSGSLNVIYNFCSLSNCSDGGSPATLIEGSDGNLYGVNADGGSGSYLTGTAFQLTPAGTLRSLYSFGAHGGYTDADSPTSLVQGSDGNLYGGSYTGGTNEDGALFRLSFSPALSAPVQLSFANNQIDLNQSATLSWQVLNGASGTLQQCYAFVQGGSSDAGTWTGLQSGTASNGIYSGSATITPTAEGTYTYALTCGGVESGFATLTVGAVQPLTISTSALPAGTQGTAYSQTLTASGGVAPYTWSVSNGSLPAGLTLNASTGVIAGTPTTSGSSTFTVKAQDAENPSQSATANLSIAINAASHIMLAVTPSTGVVYNQTVTLNATTSQTIPGGKWWITQDSFNCNTNGIVCGALPNTTNGFSVATSPLAAGAHTFYAWYSTTAPANGVLPSSGIGETAIMVAKATPAITWATPAPIAQGTPLSSTQLDATASVPGTFAYNPPAGTVLSAGSQKLSVTFTPSDGTDYTTATSSVTLTVNPAVAAPGITLSPSTLTFNSQTVGSTSAAQAVTVTNSGTAALTISSIAASGDFAQTNTCGSSVAAGANCAIAVTFKPTAAGSRSGTLTITDNASGSPQTVALSGTGASVSITPPSGTTGLSISSSGGSATATLQIGSAGGFSGTVNLTCSVAYQGSGTPNDPPTCSVSPTQATVAAGGSTNVTLTVNTTASMSAMLRPFGGGTALAAVVLLFLVPRRRWRGLALMLVLGIATATALTACGGGNSASGGSTSPSNPGTSAGNYSVTVMAASGTDTAKISLPLSVQ